MLPSLHTSASASSQCIPSRTQVRKIRAMPHLPKVSGWRSRNNASPNSAALVLPEMHSHRNLPAPGKQRPQMSPSAAATNFAQVQPSSPCSSHHMPSMAYGSSASFEVASSTRSSVIAQDTEELTEELDELLDDEDDELDLFDCKATRKWRAKEKQRRSTIQSVPSQNSSRSSHVSSRFPSISSQLPGYVGALARGSKMSRESFASSKANDSRAILDHMGSKLSKINTVMDVFLEDESKAEGCEIDEPLRKAVPVSVSEKRPRQTVIMRKIKSNLSQAQKHLKGISDASLSEWQG